MTRAFHSIGLACLMTTAMWTLPANATVTINGTSSADEILVGDLWFRDGLSHWSFVSQVKIVNGSVTNISYTTSETVYVYAGNGNDIVEVVNSVLGTIPLSVFACGSIDFSDTCELRKPATTARFRLYGESGLDTIYGSDFADRIYGGNDADALFGYGGDDDIEGGIGNDDLWGGDGNDDLVGQDGDDEIWGGNGDDYLEGGYGNDELRGEGGDDDIIGFYVSGGFCASGYDDCFGGSGSDDIWCNYIDGGTNTDACIGTTEFNCENDSSSFTLCFGGG